MLQRERPAAFAGVLFCATSPRYTRRRRQRPQPSSYCRCCCCNTPVTSGAGSPLPLSVELLFSQSPTLSGEGFPPLFNLPLHSNHCLPPASRPCVCIAQSSLLATELSFFACAQDVGRRSQKATYGGGGDAKMLSPSPVSFPRSLLRSGDRPNGTNEISSRFFFFPQSGGKTKQAFFPCWGKTY